MRAFRETQINVHALACPSICIHSFIHSFEFVHLNSFRQRQFEGTIDLYHRLLARQPIVQLDAVIYRDVLRAAGHCLSWMDTLALLEDAWIELTQTLAHVSDNSGGAGRIVSSCNRVVGMIASVCNTRLLIKRCYVQPIAPVRTVESG